MPLANELLTTALDHHRAGNLPQAEQLYRQVLAAAPQTADAWHLLGALYIQAHRPREAAQAIERAVALNPANPDYYSHLGAAYGALGEHDAAVDNLRRAVRLAPQSSTAHYNLGTALRNQGDIEGAVASFRHSIAADPNAAEAHYNLANALRDLRRFDEAEAEYREAIRLRPAYIKAMINLGNVLQDRKRSDEAIELLRTAVVTDPRHAKARLNLGSILRDARHFDEAVEVLEQAVALDPQSAEACNNLGTGYQTQARFDEAARWYEQAIALKPDLPDAHFSYGTHLLREGQLAEGFAEYEWRWRCPSFSTRTFEVPRWEGEPLAGRTILLHAEQGLGDTLQFIRYAADERLRGGRVVVECQPALCKLLATCEAIDQLVPAGEKLPHYDLYCPLMSLPGVLGLTMDQLYWAPYLHADPEHIERWSKRLPDADGLRIGICWQGNPSHLFDVQRSVPLAQFAPLALQEGVQLVSLQRGFGTEQLAGSSFDVVELGDDLDADGAFLDTAAVIKQLDLVITTDTAIAHLAGGLGAPVWVALSAHGDWRWLRDRTDSPWYPTLRLFRQRRLDAWDDVFAEIAVAVALEAQR